MNLKDGEGFYMQSKDSIRYKKFSPIASKEGLLITFQSFKN